MQTIQIDMHGDTREAVHDAVRVLEGGGVIVYPTDTLYGLGANALDVGAVQKVFAIKHRARTKPLPMIVRNIAWAKELAFIDSRVEEFLQRVWPGAVTVIVNKRNRVPDVLAAGGRTVGLRVPNHLFVDMLLAKFGYPLTATSANIAGELPSPDPKKIIRIFQDQFSQPDFIIDAGILPASEPSTVVDFTGKKPKVLRVGPAKPKELLKLLKL